MSDTSVVKLYLLSHPVKAPSEIITHSYWSEIQLKVSFRYLAMIYFVLCET